jgi:hypothetical protein
MVTAVTYSRVVVSHLAVLGCRDGSVSICLMTASHAIELRPLEVWSVGLVEDEGDYIWIRVLVWEEIKELKVGRSGTMWFVTWWRKFCGTIQG